MTKNKNSGLGNVASKNNEEFSLEAISTDLIDVIQIATSL